MIQISSSNFFEATHIASVRKVNEANQPKIPTTNPMDLSNLKYEREKKLLEKQEEYRRQMIMQQRVSSLSGISLKFTLTCFTLAGSRCSACWATTPQSTGRRCCWVSEPESRCRAIC